MNKDFEWVKWVGLFAAITVIAAFFYIKTDGNDSTNTDSLNATKQLESEESSSNNQVHNPDKSFDQNIDEAAQAMVEADQEAKEKQNNPPVYQTLSVEQTKEFIQRVESLRDEDLTINLEYTPDVARQSRKYNALYDEAESIYGSTDIANALRYCTVFVDAARDLWRLRYSPSKDAAFNKHAIKINLDTLKDAKQGCLEDVQTKVNGNTSA
ncbi:MULTISPECIES: hypothetical protein [unclassified Acinetobacter]|uniref:hypothetical protein n=1 Tax=unclassified Acinetobacter TaxID=196816 RepID=UPI00190A1D2F|nr:MULTISPECIES: hypothetical protein [unclassified Acinetobacter]MBK0063947.1 hypothetical protein [Acinetobacter sp. S55]MBK0067232.1 hypothetical protein [Acinetobacter sp. S54]